MTAAGAFVSSISSSSCSSSFDGELTRIEIGQGERELLEGHVVDVGVPRREELVEDLAFVRCAPRGDG